MSLWQQLGDLVHIIVFTQYESIASWFSHQLRMISDLESTTYVTTTDEYVSVARTLPSYSILISQLRTREYLDGERILEAEGISPRRRVLHAQILTSHFVTWALKQGFDTIINSVQHRGRVPEILRDAFTSSDCTVDTSQPMPSGIVNYRDMFDELIVNFISIGYSNADIADRLNFSVQTIRNRISRLLEESGANNRAHLAAMYLISNTLNFTPASTPSASAMSPVKSLAL